MFLHGRVLHAIDVTIQSGRQNGGERSSPSRLQPVESWRRRILAWVYPNRGWGSGQRTVEPEVAENRAKRTKPVSGNTAGFEAGETK
jgi:hypothetical protein